MKNNQFAVIGVGQFGEAIAHSLSKKGAEVMAIDKSQEKVDYIANDVAYAVALDATDKKALISQNIQKFDAVVIAIGEDFEELLLCAVNLIELNVPRIIARAKGKINRKILEKLGLKEIFSPEIEVGAVVAERLLHPTMVNFLNLADNYVITEIKAPKSIIGQTLEEIQLRESYNINLVTIKNEVQELNGKEMITRQHIKGVPHRDTIVEENDSLVIFGSNKDIEKFIDINS
jgi:trk system potassium uptake protein TrkA